eukprot:1160158-Pelagomonas_calceolata.AAC.8
MGARDWRSDAQIQWLALCASTLTASLYHCRHPSVKNQFHHHLEPVHVQRGRSYSGKEILSQQGNACLNRMIRARSYCSAKASLKPAIEWPVKRLK